jgi:hypothetical protein
LCVGSTGNQKSIKKWKRTMTELSPAAQEVFWAFNKAASGEPDDWHYLPAVAAALRAAADQVVPLADVAPQEDLESRREAMVWGMQHQTQLTRYQLLAIADELEAQ